MHDLGYVVAGYGVTAAALAWYRWRLAIRARRARTLIATLSGRPHRSPVGACAARTRR